METYKIKNYLKKHKYLLNFVKSILNIFFLVLSIFIKKKNKIIFMSFGGRSFSDSPKALYENIINNSFFNNYKFVWAFVEPEKFEIANCKKVKVDTISYYTELLSSKIWISNTGIDRNIGISRRNVISVETWHGTPIKKICGEENSTSKNENKVNEAKDNNTIRCCQSSYDEEIFMRVFNASKESFLKCDLPRNDGINKYTEKSVNEIKERLKIPKDKIVLLYVPTYREYMIDKDYSVLFDFPINYDNWEREMSKKYILLFRVHYAVNRTNIRKNSKSMIDVSNYGEINDLYAISDALISDYSSSFIDYSILEKPMFCYAYDYEEYNKMRGLYIKLEEELPCKVCKTEEELFSEIKLLDNRKMKSKVEKFKKKYAPYSGKACEAVINEIINRINSDII